MQIQINTDRNIQGHESMASTVSATIEDALRLFSANITRVEVHLGDENADKHGRNDKRCMIEARLEGRPPVAVTHHDETVAQAIAGAADKMAHLLEHTFGRLHNHRGHTDARIAAEQEAVAPPDAPQPAN
jgi:ribosome-associated translation inhibitor RaiA